MNIAIFKLRKDQYDTCVPHANGNMFLMKLEPAYRKEKTTAPAEKLHEKNYVASKHVFATDLQAVSVCPWMLSSTLYYPTKLPICT